MAVNLKTMEFAAHERSGGKTTVRAVGLSLTEPIGSRGQLQLSLITYGIMVKMIERFRFSGTRANLFLIFLFS